ncbi:MAG: hypothetical protein DMENIID0002_05340 [Rickettsia endosymbiont of Sergentomyia squamirostris]|uniref:Uncharacterized protein n=1 Tax=Candidatus Tisiphia endosymbiont of Sergentomyia squamirostris TaxID=3113639 RepID=A0AAT9G7T2_9RICK
MSKQINSLQEALTHYQETCGTFDVTLGEEDENGVLKSYIYTERFRAESLSLYAIENDFENFPSKIKQLFNSMSAVPVLTACSATGEVSVEEFVATVCEQSFLWNHGYPFATFIIMDKDNDAVVGSETYDEQLDKFVGGEFFTTLETITSKSNVASKRILKYLAFKPLDGYKHEVCKFELHYTSGSVQKTV